MLNEKNEDLCDLGPLTDDIQFAKNQFHSLHFDYVPISCNNMAHKLARYPKFVDDLEIWWRNSPSIVSLFILSEFLDE